MLIVERKGKVFEIKALAIADSYRMTCPVVRVAKAGDGDVEAERAVLDTEKWGDHWLTSKVKLWSRRR